MAIQYPDFSADPNSVPKINGLPGVMDSFQKGYQLAQLPDQLKMQKMLQQAKLDQTQSKTGLQDAQTQGALIGNQYLPALDSAKLNQYAAQTGLANKQSQYYGPLTDSEINRNNAEAAKAGQTSNGISITGYDDQGRPIIQIGGSGGTGARNGGRLGTDANGNVMSELTGSNKTAVQARAVGEDVIKPFLDQIVKTVPQFQTPEKKAQLAGSSLLNKAGLADWQDNNSYAQALGLNSDLPSQKATGDSAIVNSSEGIIKAMGLKANDQQVAMIQKALAPQPGESESGYRNRTTTFINNLGNNTQNAQKLLATGINTGEKVMMTLADGRQIPVQISSDGKIMPVQGNGGNAQAAAQQAPQQAPQPQAQPQQAPQQNTNPYGASQLPETWVPVQQPAPQQQAPAPQQAQQQTPAPNPAAVKHLTDNYTLEQLKQMRETAQ